MRVFIADDSILIRNVLEEMLAADPRVKVVGVAANGAEAVDRCLSLHPDVVIMDIDMPLMDGLEATGRLAAASSIPVLVFTHNTDPGLPFRALERGAVDFVLKPDFAALNDPAYVNAFIDRLAAIAARRGPSGGGPVHKASHNAPKDATADPPHPTAGPTPPAAPAAKAGLPRASMVFVGASTGGPQAVARLLGALPRPFPLPIALVQHIETGFAEGYAAWLAGESGHDVVLVRGGEIPRAGTVYVAPTDYHILFSGQALVLDDGVKVLSQKPSVDVLFRSAAERFGPSALGVLLTGMGSDGAEGCAAIRAKGGFTLVQDEASSVIFGMPKAAIVRGAASLVLSLEAMGPFLVAVAEASS